MDINEFFRQQETKLYERPPEQLWQRLEQRLEQRRRQRREIRFLQIGLVALALAILLFAAVMVWYFSRKH
jgi:hypothetical protein